MAKDLMSALKQLLLGREANTQGGLCLALQRQGHEVNQSKISRMLRKIGAIKVVNSQGEAVYSLPREPAPPSMDASLHQLILDVAANESLIIISTSPGSASMVARLLDYQQNSMEILGTIAGDDTIFVAPKSVKNVQTLKKQIEDLFII